MAGVKVKSQSNIQNSGIETHSCGFKYRTAAFLLMKSDLEREFLFSLLMVILCLMIVPRLKSYNENLNIFGLL